MYSRGDCTTMWKYLMTPNCTLKMAKMVNFILFCIYIFIYFTTIKTKYCKKFQGSTVCISLSVLITVRLKVYTWSLWELCYLAGICQWDQNPKIPSWDSIWGSLVPRCSIHASVVPEPQRKCTLPGPYWGRTIGVCTQLLWTWLWDSHWVWQVFLH